MKEYRRCSRCVMDNSSDPTIVFDADGRCNYCTEALESKKVTYFPNQEGERKLNALLTRIKTGGGGLRLSDGAFGRA